MFQSVQLAGKGKDRDVCYCSTLAKKRCIVRDVHFLVAHRIIFFRIYVSCSCTFPSSTFLAYGHPLVPSHPDKGVFTVISVLRTHGNY